SAGRQIRMAQGLHKRWKALFGNDVAPGGRNASGTMSYTPFASKLDWEIAQWMVNNGIGHNSFNRLLAIDSVS
ncbi:hypothetical protein CYLTODRAFT_315102, partial [Cylindrobasidium torrendii FP15055 ss-10]